MVYSAIITFGSAAIQLTDATNGVTDWPAHALARRVLIEPLRGNGAAAYVGLANVSNNGTGVSIQELAAPVTGVPLDRFNDPVSGAYLVDPAVFWVHGTSGQKVKVTLVSN